MLRKNIAIDPADIRHGEPPRTNLNGIGKTHGGGVYRNPRFHLARAAGIGFVRHVPCGCDFFDTAGDVGDSDVKHASYSENRAALPCVGACRLVELPDGFIDFLGYFFIFPQSASWMACSLATAFRVAMTF